MDVLEPCNSPIFSWVVIFARRRELNKEQEVVCAELEADLRLAA